MVLTWTADPSLRLFKRKLSSGRPEAEHGDRVFSPNYCDTPTSPHPPVESSKVEDSKEEPDREPSHRSLQLRRKVQESKDGDEMHLRTGATSTETDWPRASCVCLATCCSLAAQMFRNHKLQKLHLCCFQSSHGTRVSCVTSVLKNKIKKQTQLCK